MNLKNTFENYWNYSFIRKFLTFLIISITLFSCNKPSINAIISTSEKRIQQGDSCFLKWEVFPNDEIDNFSIDDVNDKLAMSGQSLIYPEQSKTYNLRVTNKKGKEKKFSTRLNILYPDFEVLNYPLRVYDDDPILINWKASNAKWVSIKGIDDTLSVSGFYSIILDSSHQFTIRAYNKNGRFTEKKVTIFLSQPDEINGDSVLCNGEEITLYWNFKNSTKVRISGIDSLFKPTDQITLKPEKSAIYKFITTRVNGKNETKTFRVFVLPENMVNFKCPDKVERGGEIDLSWEVKNIDSLIFTNGKRAYKMPSNGSIRQKVNDNTKFDLIFKYNGLTYRYPKYTKIVERKFIEGNKSINNIGAKNKLNFEIFGVDKSKYPDEIKLYVLVVDTFGYFITNLVSETDRKNSFRKYFKQLVENIEGKKYPVNNFDVKEIYNMNTKSDFSIVLDYSGSMSSDVGYLERSMNKFIKLVNDKDRISIVKFDETLDNLFSLTDDKTEIYNKYQFKGLNDMGGSTALYAGTDLGFRQFDSVDSRIKRLILFTDGNENASYSYRNQYAVTANAVIAKARNLNIPMYIISFGSGTNIDLLDEMASLSGGKHYNIRNHKSLEKVFNEFFRTTKYFYEITYKPKIADRERSIDLIYNNNIKTESTTSKIYIGEDYDVMPIELNNGNSNSLVSLSDSLKKISKLKASNSPQVITLFDFDKTEILPKYKEVIISYAKIMKERSKCEAVLIGHTDRVGNDEYCYRLSYQRANEIKDALVQQGIKPERIKILGFGKQQPVWNPEKNETQARENRRVEIIIME